MSATIEVIRKKPEPTTPDPIKEIRGGDSQFPFVMELTGWGGERPIHFFSSGSFDRKSHRGVHLSVSDARAFANAIIEFADQLDAGAVR